MIEEVDAILGETFHFPFNNFGKILALDDPQPLPDSLGGNCIWFAHRLMRVLGPHFDSIRPVRDPHNFHHGLVALQDDQSFYIDPVLFLDHALPLNQLGPGRQNVETRLTFCNQQAVFRIRVSLKPDSLDFHLVPRTKEVHYSMGLNETPVDLPSINDDRIALMSGDNGVLIRKITPDGITRTLNLSPSYNFCISVRDANGIISFNQSYPDGSSNGGFSQQVGELTESVQTDFNRLAPLMLRAMRRKSW